MVHNYTKGRDDSNAVFYINTITLAITTNANTGIVIARCLILLIVHSLSLLGPAV